VDAGNPDLSEREAEVLAYVKVCRRGAPFSPTYPEIADKCVKENGESVSPQFAARVVHSLVDKGFLVRDRNGLIKLPEEK
jgi:hypothetical protein